MKMTIDIVLTVMILGWPGLIMFSPMIFDAPGSEHDKSRILFLLLIILYPTLIFVVYKLVGATYFHLSAKWPLLVTILITAYVVMLFGYPRYIYNAWQGIDDTGYFVAKDAVYFGGVRLKTASAASFEKIGDRYSDYARDARQVYFQGKVLAGADPASFAPVQSSLFWQDKHHVYADGQALSEASVSIYAAQGAKSTMAIRDYKMPTLQRSSYWVTRLAKMMHICMYLTNWHRSMLT